MKKRKRSLGRLRVGKITAKGIETRCVVGWPQAVAETTPLREK